uniref:Uncharacterized protein n=1 Tax=Globodera rostochiensis TaxID=31243 RepID=A0A914GZH0_GLORO
MEANATLNEVYLELMKACPSMFGIVMNFFVVYVTIRTKHFDSSANKFIDRLIYVIFPLKNHKNVFIYGITLPIVGICGSFLVYIINTKPVDDLISSATTILFLLATVSIYVLLAILLRFQTASSNSNWHQFNIRIFRSLFIIVSVNIGGYLLIALTLVTRTIFEFDLLAKWKFAHIIGILLNISAASNAPILYFNSQEYRKAFDKELQNIAKICKRNAVQPEEKYGALGKNEIITCKFCQLLQPKRLRCQ